MKLFAHSTVPQKMPYVHLAYTAATTMTPQIGLGLTGFGFMVAGAVFAVRGTRGALRPAPGSRPWRGILGLCAGLLVIAGGVKLLAVARDTGSERRQYPEEFTQLAMRTVEQEIRTAWEKGDEVARRRSEIDGWYQRILVRELPSQDGPTYELRSAGPDRSYDTIDDMTYVVVVTRPK